MRRWALIVVTFLCAAAAFFLFSKSTPKKYLENYPLFLIDHLNEDTVTPRELISTPVLERNLEGSWEKIEATGTSTIWTIELPETVRHETGIQLSHQGTALPRGDVLERKPNVWNESNNRIWVSRSSAEMPKKDEYRLRYVRAETTTIPNTFTFNLKDQKIQSQSETGNGSRNFYFIPFPDGIHGSSKPVDVSIKTEQPQAKADHKTVLKISKASNILASQASQAEWRDTLQWDSLLHDPTVDRPLDFFRRRTRWKGPRLFLAGPVRLTLWASTDSAKSSPPSLAIYYGKQRAGTIQVSSTDSQPYHLDSITPGGWMGIKFVLENDQNSDTGPTRRILVDKIQLTHPRGILLSLPQSSEKNVEVTARFQQVIATGAEPLHEMIADYRKDDQWMHSIAFKKELYPDTRSAIAMIPNTTITLPVHLAPKAVLKFAYKFESQNCPSKQFPEFQIQMSRSFLRSENIFNQKWNELREWTEKEISLEKFAGEKGLLRFEVKGSSDPSCGNTLWVANPYITAETTNKGANHVIIISADALRSDHLGCYGYQRDTSPFIDQFSKESVLFENASSHAPWTLPSFATLFTSLYPSFHKTTTRFSSLSDSHIVLAELLREKNYLTAAFNKNGFLAARRGFAQGFDWYRSEATFDKSEDERVQEISKWLDRHREKKTFLFVHFLEPHSPYTPPPEYKRKFTNGEKTMDTTTDNLVLMNQNGTVVREEERAYMMDLYDAEISYLDSVFGKLIQKLKDLGIYDSSLILFMSDHGEEFQDHGKWMHTNSLYQELVHVPLILKFPKTAGMKGKRISANVGLIDVMPTLLEYLKVQPRGLIQGKSLIPILLGKNHSERAVFLERNDNQLFAVRHKSMKYILQGPSSSKEQPREELYNLQMDPAEKRNITNMHPELLQFFRDVHGKFLESLAKYEKTSHGQKATTIELSAEEEEQLHALGYVQ